MEMPLTNRDIELIGLKAGEAAHAAIGERIADLRRIMREEARQIMHDCSIKDRLPPIEEQVRINKLGIRKLAMLMAGAGIGGGAVSRLPDILAALRAAF